MKQYLLCCFAFILLITSNSNAQQDTSQSNNPFTIEAEIGNPSKSINDGFIQLKVLGGSPPYRFEWSNKETALDSNRASSLVEGIEYKVDYSTYEEIMDFYENEKVGKLPPFLRKIIEMCLEDLIITNKKVKETFINQLVRATIKTFFDTTIDELEMIYQYGEEYFERYREELPTKNKKVVSG